MQFYFVLGIHEPDKSSLELSIVNDGMNYANITNILQAKTPTPEKDLSENGNETQIKEHGEAGELDNVLTYDIFDDDINEIKKTLQLILMGDRNVLR